MVAIKRIKDNIDEVEFKHLLNYLIADENIRMNRKQRLLKSFIILYHTGLRVNETTQLKNHNILELIKNKQTKVIAHKQNLEKIVYITDKTATKLKKVFGTLEDNSNYIFCSERGNGQEVMKPSAVINDTNSYLKKVFPNKNITSHSFRQTLITDLAEANINTKVIQALIGHKDISSTYRYIKPSQDSIINSLNVVR